MVYYLRHARKLTLLPRMLCLLCGVNADECMSCERYALNYLYFSYVLCANRCVQNVMHFCSLSYRQVFLMLIDQMNHTRHIVLI